MGGVSYNSANPQNFSFVSNSGTLVILSAPNTASIPCSTGNFALTGVQLEVTFSVGGVQVNNGFAALQLGQNFTVNMRITAIAPSGPLYNSGYSANNRYPIWDLFDNMHATAAAGGLLYTSVNPTPWIARFAQPTVTVTPSTATTVCVGGNLTATASGGSGSYSSYLWSPATALSATNVSNPSFTGTIAGQVYGVTITDSNNCKANANSGAMTVVNDPATPTATQSPSATTVCAGTTLTLTGVSSPSGGAGTCDVQYSHNGGTYTTTLTPFAAVAGTNTIA
ncbi:hypothetical protein C7N43_25765, partial [Sphingobacteriales bacterium UPWRP_1]